MHLLDIHIGGNSFPLFAIVSSILFASGYGYSLTVTPVYVVFSADLEIGFNVPANSSISGAFVSLVNIRKNQDDQEITSKPLPGRDNTGKIVISCGVIEYAGRYTIQMYMFVGSPLLVQVKFRAVWADFQLILPQSMDVLTTHVEVQLKSHATCDPKLHREMFYIELYFKRQSLSAERILHLKKSNLIASVNITSISKRSIQDVSFECSLFDLDGVYQAVMKSSFNSGSFITRSGLLNATWSRNYHVDLRVQNKPVDSIFPCKSDIRLTYTQPACAGKDEIRIYEVHHTSNGSRAAPREQRYLLERHANSDTSSLLLSCSMFKRRTVGYCFKYYSVSRSGAVRLQTHTCVPSHQYTDGEWSSWSSWSDCTVTCGSGKRNRYRLCSDPAPSPGGYFCRGDPIQWKPCPYNPCPKYIPDGPLNTPLPGNQCPCGCDVTGSSGVIYASGRCSGSAVWTIRTDQHRHIKLMFQYFRLLHSRQRVMIRDGVRPDGNVLFTSFGKENVSGEFVSTSNEMTVELFTSRAASNTSDYVYYYGFIVRYKTVHNYNVMGSAVISNPQSATIFDSVVTMTGIPLCVVVVLVVVVFALLHRRYRRRYKYRMAASESPVHAGKESKQSSRCSSPAQDEDNVDLETPLTGKPPKGSIISRASSISSTCSNGLKKLRSKAEIVTGSPKPSTKNYSPLPSPFTEDSKDLNQKPDFLKAGSNLKHHVPLSPKPRVSPKLRRSPAVTPYSPSKTKYDLLTEKRKMQLDNDLGGSAEAPGVSKDSCQSDKKSSTPVGKTGQAQMIDRFAADRVVDGDKTPQNELIAMGNLKMRVRQPASGETQSGGDHSTTSFIQPTGKARRPTSLTESYSPDSTSPVKQTNKEKKKKTNKRPSAMEERQTLLPKPDGQSPSYITHEELSRHSSPSSTHSSRSAKTLSPSKSATTPSDIGSVDIELEYDDFIEDDPLSYFEVSELQKLRWQGGEKIGKPIRK